MAVGDSQSSARPQAMVERWNGRAWRTKAIPRRARTTQFLGVSCSRARACTAVGYRTNAGGNGRPLAMSWNGKKWRVQTVPLPHGAPAGIFDAVSCTSPRACTATGTVFDPGGVTLAERWNGKVWRVERTPNPADYRNSVRAVELDGISCSSARACTASGEYSPHGSAAYFIESWNGRRWRREAAPHPADFAHGALLSMSCASVRCTAVGAYTGKVRLQVTLAMSGRPVH